LILLDEERRGCAATVNELAGGAVADWLFILADDDLMLPRCLELLMAASKAQAGVGVFYSPPLVWGEDGAQFCASPPNIPSAALIGRELWEKIGGYSLDAPSAEDGVFWRQVEQRGATFVRVDEHPTWVYRFHGKNKSRTDDF
jgi:hypothetical protein